ncbi:hypothetical protein BpHYR1_022541 [Brachionus plicatilis]|uniref:Uncharacterized protein n=1 Tax=Brachionus plicatilis TaxID=10195 RepID=A0A3M7QL24_BRAPC|nr:hypothetical protein BpHYR1_022541 [Brachionus plicatilis]
MHKTIDKTINLQVLVSFVNCRIPAIVDIPGDLKSYEFKIWTKSISKMILSTIFIRVPENIFKLVKGGALLTTKA